MTVFDPAGMRSRRAEYFAYVRSKAAAMFQADGTYQPATENDPRIAYWILPAFMDSPLREFGLTIYNAGKGWDAFDVFNTSLIAAHLVRHHDQLTPALRRRSEDHLAKFTIAGNGRLPSANVYDYMFHGFNDNMPAMATRTMILAGDALARPEFTDAGLFHLEGLAAHFQRRGMLSEHTSPTYTPITLCALLDIAELSANRDARELAQMCADRVLLDLLGHWHWDTGTSGGTTARAYTVDVTETLSVLNAYIWYVSGHPLTIDPRDETYDGPVHHGGNRPFNLAQFVEVMNASHAGVKPALIEFARQPRRYPYTIRATSDWASVGRGVQTRSFQQSRYWLATSSTNNTGSCAGQATLLHGVIARVAKPASWRDRVAFWTRWMAGEDYGTADHVNDWGRYQTAQQADSAMLVAAAAPELGDRPARFAFLLTALPDELFENDQPVPAWDGVATAHTWQFLRYGDVFLGVRLSAQSPVRRVVRGGYVRLEVEPVSGDLGCLVEMGTGSFAEFRQAVLATTWEFHHNFYRCSRWLSRNGELQIVDSPKTGTARFIAIDGEIETETKFAATGMDPALVELPRRVRQRRTLYRPDCVATPFYDRPGRVMEAR
jgi:hypothetical protein